MGLYDILIFYGCRLLKKIHGKVNQALYKEILEVGLSSTIYFYDMDPRRVIFQQIMHQFIMQNQ